jgi:AraC-like DNA-binding protein
MVQSDGAHDLVPDACVDVVWVSDGSVWICGPETRGWTFQVPGGSEAVGIRFRPGHAGAAFRVGLDEIRETQVRVEEILGRDGSWLAEQLADETDATARIRVLEAHARRWTADRRPDPAADHLAQRFSADPAAGVAVLARELGVSERQLLRRCVVTFGYGPATLRRILRLQRFLRLAEDPDGAQGLSALALAAGFVDQQHLARTTHAIARTTPSRLLDARRSPRPMSDPSTTDPPSDERLA